MQHPDKGPHGPHVPERDASPRLASDLHPGPQHKRGAEFHTGVRARPPASPGGATGTPALRLGATNQGHCAGRSLPQATRSGRWSRGGLDPHCVQRRKGSALSLRVYPLPSGDPLSASQARPKSVAERHEGEAPQSSPGRKREACQIPGNWKAGHSDAKTGKESPYQSRNSKMKGNPPKTPRPSQHFLGEPSASRVSPREAGKEGLGLGTVFEWPGISAPSNDSAEAAAMNKLFLRPAPGVG